MWTVLMSQMLDMHPELPCKIASSKPSTHKCRHILQIEDQPIIVEQSRVTQLERLQNGFTNHSRCMMAALHIQRVPDAPEAATFTKYRSDDRSYLRERKREAHCKDLYHFCSLSWQLDHLRHLSSLNSHQHGSHKAITTYPVQRTGPRIAAVGSAP